MVCNTNRINQSEKLAGMGNMCLMRPPLARLGEWVVCIKSVLP